MGFFIEERNGSIDVKLGRIAFAVVAVAVVLIILFRCLVIVGAGQVGVKDTFGSVDPNVLQPGIGLKAPWTGVVKFDTKTKAFDMTGQNEANVLSSEGLTVGMSGTVLYRVDGSKAPELYKTVGTDYDTKIMLPEVRGALRQEVAKYKAEDLYSQERGQIAASVKDYLNAKLGPRGIIVEDVIIRNVELPPQISAAIQAKLTAQQQISQKDFEVQVAEKAAEVRRQDAQGIADANRIISDSLSENYLQYEWIQSIKNHPGSIIYVPTGNDGLQMFKSV